MSTMGGRSVHPGVLYFYSESVGVSVNALCALVSGLSLLGGESTATLNGFILLSFGGIVQLACTARAFRAYDHFGAATFGVFSAFWTVLGLGLLTNVFVDELYISLLFANVLLLVSSFFVSGYYVSLLSSFAIASTVKVVSFYLHGADEQANVNTVQGILLLLVSGVCCYGVLAAILYGNHERDILPGFQDAIVETTLWKRKPNVSTYIEGNWANPKPLSKFCNSLGFCGLFFSLILQTTKSTMPHYNIALSYWYATFGTLLWFSSFVFGLRKEPLMTMSCSCDAAFFLCLSYATGIRVDSSAQIGALLLPFGLFQVMLHLFGTSSLQGKAHELDLVSSLSMVLCFMSFVIAITLNSQPAYVIASIFAFLTITILFYSALANLINSIAQKEILAVGLHKRISFRCPRSFSSSRSDDMKMGLSFSKPTIDQHEEFVLPGDGMLLGVSEFQSPLFVMIAGLFLSATVSTIVMFSNERSTSVLGESFIVTISWASAVFLIFAFRGQTSYAFNAFTYFLGSLLSLATLLTESGEGSLIPLLFIQISLQIVWLVTSFREFVPLSLITVLHVLGVTAISLSILFNNILFQVIGAILFLFISITSCCTLVLLVGANFGKESCRKILVALAKKSGAREAQRSEMDRCPLGFAQSGIDFERCVDILQNGGVVCIPTDTVYCLACKANNPQGIKRIYSIKTRPAEKPLSLWMSSIKDIQKACPQGEGWCEKLIDFMDALWPGSVSLVVSRGDWLNNLGVGEAADLIGTPDSIALRVPNASVTLNLMKATGPLAITSANPSGACDCTHHNQVDDMIASKIDYILADGPSPMTIASSVIDVRRIEKDELFFYRVGCIPEVTIWQTLREINDRQSVPENSDQQLV